MKEPRCRGLPNEGNFDMAKILLIDDEEIVRSCLRFVLENGGHEVFEASDGEEGVSKFKEMASISKPINVVVTDILMPKKNGYETIAEIQDIMRDVKIIAISGGGGADPKEILDISTNFLGVDQVLVKPVLSEELLKAVDHCLQ